MSTTFQNDLRTLDQTRQRLFTLTSTLHSLRHSLEASDPLPSWSTLSTTFTLLTHNLSLLTSVLSSTSTAPFLSHAHAYPLPSFPIEQEAILDGLLRKKLDPGVEDWIDDAVKMFERRVEEVGVGGMDEVQELWEWARPRAGQLAGGVPWGADYSVEERERGVEGVVTGIKREMNVGVVEDENDDEDDEDEDEDDDEGDQEKEGAGEMEGVEEGVAVQRKVPGQAMMSLEETLKFASTGVMPSRTMTASGALR